MAIYQRGRKQAILWFSDSHISWPLALELVAPGYNYVLVDSCRLLIALLLAGWSVLS